MLEDIDAAIKLLGNYRRQVMDMDVSPLMIEEIKKKIACLNNQFDFFSQRRNTKDEEIVILTNEYARAES